MPDLFLDKQLPLSTAQVNLAPPWIATHGTEVTGQLVDRTNGSPVARVLIPSSEGKRITTDTQGRFVARVADGCIRVQHPKYIDYFACFGAPAKAPRNPATGAAMFMSLPFPVAPLPCPCVVFGFGTCAPSYWADNSSN